MKIVGVGFILLLALAFSKSDSWLLDELKRVPGNFPEVIHPSGNELTVDRWKLGKKLFFDPVLSRDSSISCASCHAPQFAFSDTVGMSIGVEGRLGIRNAPSLANVAYHPYLTRDGSVSSLEQQVLVPIQDHVEFDFNIVKIEDRLLKDSAYNSMSRIAYGTYPSSFVITSALACFERTLISGKSSFDDYVAGNRSALNEHQINGMNLFFGKAGCSECHSGFNFTNYEILNNGLYLSYADSGKMRVTLKEEDRAKFKVPTLRNVLLTAPYMHDGSLSTIEEVVDHYSDGIQPHRNKAKGLKKLLLTEKEKSELKTFLESLTDSSFCSNPLFKINT